VALSEIDRNLLERCLARKDRAWEDFVDRFIGLVIHVINHTAQARSIRLTAEDREDLCAEVFMTFVTRNFAVLRQFRGQSSLATYLTVVARRVVVAQLVRRKNAARLADSARGTDWNENATAVEDDLPQRISNQEEVQRLIEQLDEQQAQVVRLYHLEGKTYQEISDELGIPENSVGPTLTRARRKMRAFGSGSRATNPAGAESAATDTPATDSTATDTPAADSHVS
jgi:RNA polymerase sigma-70 factor (ECF subfamily)